MNSNMDNLFVYGTATYGDCFMDREQETMHLKQNFLHCVNTMLISPRRWGKTSLVHHAGEQLCEQEGLKIVYIDIFSCRSEEDFYRIFATEIIRQTSGKLEELLEHAKHFLSGLSPKVSISTDPFNEISVSLEPGQKPYTEEVLHLPERIAEEKGIHIVICIDEFQQIGELPNSLIVQKKLRSVWQHQRLTHYCLYGSKRHLLMKMFCKNSYPFYKFGDTIFLERIPTTYWVEYIQSRFAISEKTVDAALCEDICEYVENNSSYVQQLAWLLWIRTTHVADEAALAAAKEDLMRLNHVLFQSYTDMLSAYQMRLLQAIAAGHGGTLSTQAVIQQFKLGSSANVAKLKAALEEKELIENGKVCEFADPLYKKWILRHIS